MLEQVEQYNQYIILILAALLLISFFTHLILWSKIKRLNTSYRRLTRGINKKNLEEIIIEFTNKVNEMEKEIAVLKKTNEEMAEEIKSCVKTPEILRFNAFDNMGSNLSFSLALLDSNNNGLVMTNISSREDSRFYAKSIREGKSEQYLTPEEESVVDKIIKEN